MLYCLSSKFIKKDTKKTMSLWTHLVQHLPAGVYLLKVSNENTKAMCEICSKSMIKTPKRRYNEGRSDVFIINSE